MNPEDTFIGRVRQAIVAALAPLTQGEYGCQVTPYWKSSPTAPYMFVTLGDPAVEWDATFGRGTDRWKFFVVGAAGAMDTEASQMIHDRWFEPYGNTSVKQLIEADGTLGGLLDDLRVTQTSSPQPFTREGAGTVLTAIWTIEGLAPGKETE